MQPIERDHRGVIRFRPNKIVEWLFRTGALDLNIVATMDFPREDHVQLAQLIGYSVSGFGDLSYVQPEERHEADRQAALLQLQTT